MLEFALFVPFIILFIYLVLDVGRIALTYTALQEATASSARAIARTGKVGDVGNGTCPETPGSVPSSQVALYAFCNAAQTVPYMLQPQLTPSEMTPPSNGFCFRGSAGFIVEVNASASPSLVGPWGALAEPLGYEVTATAVARCEVGR